MPFVRVCTLCYRRLQLKNKINLLVAICCLAVLEVSFGREDWQCGSQCHSGFASGCGGDREFSTSHPTWLSQNAAHSKVTGLYTLHKVLQQNLKCSLTDPSSGSFHWPPGVGFFKRHTASCTSRSVYPSAPAWQSAWECAWCSALSQISWTLKTVCKDKLSCCCSHSAGEHLPAPASGASGCGM